MRMQIVGFVRPRVLGVLLSQPEIKRVLEVVDGWGCDLTLLTNPRENSNEFSEHR